MQARAAPQPGDQRQHVDEHLPRHRDLRHLKGDTRLTTLALILISFSRRLVSDHGCVVFGIASKRMKLPRSYARTWC
jgi:hypothetical protein